MKKFVELGGCAVFVCIGFVGLVVLAGCLFNVGFFILNKIFGP